MSGVQEGEVKTMEVELAESVPKEKGDGEPEGKRQKTDEVAPAAVNEAVAAKKKSGDPAAIRKQVEYYFSDENLRHDKFFHQKITEDAEGWLAIDLIISCNKMKAMGTTKEDVVNALKESKLELKDGGAAIRRPGNVPLPALEERQQHGKKNAAHVHAGGAMVLFRKIPEEQSWVQVKEGLKAALPEKANIWFVSEVSDKNTCFVATAPFDNDVQFFEKLELDLGGSKVKSELCQGNDLATGLKLLPKHIRERREKESRKRQKERNKPIQVGTQKFVNVGALRGRVKEIINSRSDGEQLKPEGSDFKLIKAMLGFHPKGPEKSNGLVGIKVAPSIQGENRCFFMLKEDGTEEDFSAKKCLEAIEKNPPYAQTEAPKDKPAGDKPGASEPAKDEPAASGASEAAQTSATAGEPVQEKPAVSE